MTKLIPILLLLAACGKSGDSSDGGAVAKAANAGAATPAPSTPPSTGGGGGGSSTGGSTTPAPAPSTLPPSKDFTVTGYDGKPVKLSSLVTGTNMVITLTESSWFCWECRGIAEAIDLSTTIQAELDGTKCSYASIVVTADAADWFTSFSPTATPTPSFVGLHSYSTDKAFADIATMEGIEFSATPTTFIINKKGDVVAKSIDPSTAIDACK